MQATAGRRSIRQTFDELRANGRIALVPFLPAGFPELATMAACLPEIEAAGASAIEIGIPFSDPIADGPVIQEAFTAALAKKVRVTDVFRAIAAARSSVSLPLIAMLSYSIVFRYGVERFSADARECGFDGLIIPDLPPPEAQQVTSKIRAAGLDTTLLVAPTTTPERRREVAELCSGFIYYLSVAGITGERDPLPPDVEPNVRQLKSLTDRPVCVGFGIHKPTHLAQLAGIADGAIVGTAYVRRIKQHTDEKPSRIAQILGDYTRELLSDVR